ncbi:hypothetical protein HDV57DRAFT_494070 [Trichoderma longibrachiatum]
MQKNTRTHKSSTIRTNQRLRTYTSAWKRCLCRAIRCALVSCAASVFSVVRPIPMLGWTDITLWRAWIEVQQVTMCFSFFSSRVAAFPGAKGDQSWTLDGWGLKHIETQTGRACEWRKWRHCALISQLWSLRCDYGAISGLLILGAITSTDAFL